MSHTLHMKTLSLCCALVCERVILSPMSHWSYLKSFLCAASRVAADQTFGNVFWPMLNILISVSCFGGFLEQKCL